MHSRTSQSCASRTPALPEPALRCLLVAAVFAMAILAGCASRTTRAPVTDLTGAPVSSQTNDTYVVAPGDTLYKIAQKHGTDVQALMRANNISDPTQLQPGQVLQLGGAGTGVATAHEPEPSGGSGAVATPVPVTPVKVEPATLEMPPRASDASLITWDWPASGGIIQSFNSNTKGIDIAGAIGEPVLAAADGKVMYAGNGVRGLGNLILLGHSNGFITAYAHNKELLVKTGETVKKGKKIATIGETDTTSPRLHFEIRRRGTPVNPLSYLPSR